MHSMNGRISAAPRAQFKPRLDTCRYTHRDEYRDHANRPQTQASTHRDHTHTYRHQNKHTSVYAVASKYAITNDITKPLLTTNSIIIVFLPSMFYSLFCLDSCTLYVFKSVLSSSFFCIISSILLCIGCVFHVFFYCSLISLYVTLVRLSLVY